MPSSAAFTRAVIPKATTMTSTIVPMRRVLPVAIASMTSAAPHNDGGSSFARIVSVLQIVRMVIGFEWDRPFVQHWYGEKPEFDIPGCRAKASQLGLTGLAEEVLLRDRLTLYIQNVEAYLSP